MQLARGNSRRRRLCDANVTLLEKQRSVIPGDDLSPRSTIVPRCNQVEQIRLLAEASRVTRLTPLPLATDCADHNE